MSQKGHRYHRGKLHFLTERWARHLEIQETLGPSLKASSNTTLVRTEMPMARPNHHARRGQQRGMQPVCDPWSGNLLKLKTHDVVGGSDGRGYVPRKYCVSGRRPQAKRPRWQRGQVRPGILMLKSATRRPPGETDRDTWARDRDIQRAGDTRGGSHHTASNVTWLHASRPPHQQSEGRAPEGRTDVGPLRSCCWAR